MADWRRHGAYRDFANRRLVETLVAGGVDGALLDIGCGTGAVIARSIELGVTSYGVDIARGVVRYHGRETGLPAAQADAAQLPFRDGAFGAIVCLGLVEHMADPAATLREFRRVVSGTGRAAISVPALWSVFPLFAPTWYVACGRGGTWRGMVGRMYSRRRFNRVLRKAGWEVDRVVRYKAASFLDYLRVPFSATRAEMAESNGLVTAVGGIMMCAYCHRSGG